MPTRLIREGIISSDKVEMLDPPGEVFYRRLLNKVDDHGLYDARPSILRANLYPLRIDRVREADITRWMAACQKAGLIVLYENGGKPYLMVLNTEWDKRSKPKYPLPPENNPKQSQADPNTSTVVRSRISLSVDGTRPSADADPWLLGKEFLIKRGVTESTVGGFLGKLVKDHGKPAVVEALQAAIVNEPADVKGYMLGALRGKSAKFDPVASNLAFIRSQQS